MIVEVGSTNREGKRKGKWQANEKKGN